jgi:hypothetical protein
MHHQWATLSVSVRRIAFEGWGLISSLFQLSEDLIILWKSACFVLGENKIPIDDHIEYAVLPFDEL